MLFMITVVYGMLEPKQLFFEPAGGALPAPAGEELA